MLARVGEVREGGQVRSSRAGEVSVRDMREGDLVQT